MVLNSVWQELGIEETDDIRLIKRSYAKKLKLVRPDEKPEEFQQLHQAYKQALSEAQWLAEQKTEDQDESAFEFETDKHFDNNVNLSTGIENPLTEIQIDQPPQSTEIIDSPTQSTQHRAEDPEPEIYAEQAVYLHQPEIDRLMELVEQNMENVSKFYLGKWKFIVESEYILDPEFSWYLGIALLDRIAQYYNDQKYREDGDFRITIEVLRYLNSIFHWDEKGIDISDYVTDEYGLSLFDNLMNCEYHIENAERDAIAGLRGAKSIKQVKNQRRAPFKTYYYGSGLQRVAAFAIDIIIIIPIVMFVKEFSDVVIGYKLTQVKNFNFYFGIGIYLFASWLFESSHFQSTPGKFIMGLRVITASQRKIGLLHGILRTTVFAISSIGFYITIFINSWMGGNMIHDRLTKSYVMDLRRSEKDSK